MRLFVALHNFQPDLVLKHEHLESCVKHFWKVKLEVSFLTKIPV